MLALRTALDVGLIGSHAQRSKVAKLKSCNCGKTVDVDWLNTQPICLSDEPEIAIGSLQEHGG